MYRNSEKKLVLKKEFSKYRGFIVDLDGTIYLDDQIIPKSDTIINRLIESDKKVVFVSNKTTETTETYYKFLSMNGFKISKSQILNSTFITAKYLKEHFPKSYFYAVSEKNFIEEIADAGLIYTTDYTKVEIVLITLDRTLTFEKLEIAAKSLERNAKFFAANIDDTCPIVDGEIFDAGSTISALERRTNRMLEKYFGKPSELILNEAINLLDVPKSEVLIIGDRPETDIRMGNAFNVDAALVMTGVRKLKNSTYAPQFILNSIADIMY